MNTTPHETTAFNDADCTDADRLTVSEFAKRIFFVTGEPGCGKSTFLAALMKKYNLRPSGFITKKEAAPSEVAVYMHPVIDGTAQYRYTTGNRIGICSPSKPAGFAPVFDACGVMCLKQAEEAVLASLGGGHDGADCSGVIQKHNTAPEAEASLLIPPTADRSGAGCAETVPEQSALPVILMDELGVMEAEAENFFRTVCTLFSNPRYYIIGAVKPRGTRFLPVLEQMPEAAVFHLTPQNRTELYEQLERAQSFAAFLEAAGIKGI